MITIISGTNRPNSLTKKFSEVYVKQLLLQGQEAQLFSLDNLPDAVFCADVYEKVKHPAIQQIQDLLKTSTKYVFIFPEYNGSYPGILKLLIDVMDPKVVFQGKKAGMIGISTGRAGNLRGLDQLSAVLHHMNVTVMPYMLPVSRVHLEMNEESILNEATQKLVDTHINRMITF